MNYKKIIIFDFDGVIHEYKSKWTDASTISDGPVPGIKELIHELRKTYRVVIVSSRCVNHDGIQAVKAWLCYHEIEVDDICKEKPPAYLTIDDRCICFDGNTQDLIERINNFKPWNK